MTDNNCIDFLVVGSKPLFFIPFIGFHFLSDNFRSQFLLSLFFAQSNGRVSLFKNEFNHFGWILLWFFNSYNRFDENLFFELQYLLSHHSGNHRIFSLIRIWNFVYFVLKFFHSLVQYSILKILQLLLNLVIFLKLRARLKLHLLDLQNLAFVLDSF